MIVEYVRYRVPLESAAAFEADYARAAVSLQESPECVDYELARCTEAPDPDGPPVSDFVLRIRWTSAEDHLQGFRGGPSFRPFFAAIRPWFPNIQEMRHYEVGGVAGPGAAPSR